MVTKKICRKKKIHSEKKNTADHQKEWVSAEKKNTAGKKNTAAQQKEWVSGSTIFSREKNNTRPLMVLKKKEYFLVMGKVRSFSSEVSFFLCAHSFY